MVFTTVKIPLSAFCCSPATSLLPILLWHTLPFWPITQHRCSIPAPAATVFFWLPKSNAVTSTGKLRLRQKSLCLCSSVDRTDHPGRTHSCAGWGWSINVPETEVTVKRPISTVMTRAVRATARSNGIYPRVLKQVKSTIAELLPALCDPCFISLWHLGRGRQ